MCSGHGAKFPCQHCYPPWDSSLNVQAQYKIWVGYRLRIQQNHPQLDLWWFYCFLVHWVTWQPGIRCAKNWRRPTQESTLPGAAWGSGEGRMWGSAQPEAQDQTPSIPPTAQRCPLPPTQPIPAPSHIRQVTSCRLWPPSTQPRSPGLSSSPAPPPHRHTVIDKNKRSAVTCHGNENCSGGRNWERFVLQSHKRFKSFSP